MATTDPTAPDAFTQTSLQSSLTAQASHPQNGLAELCAAILPVWNRHLASARNQSETAVTQMLSAFAAIGPHLDMAKRQSQQITAALAQGEGGIKQLAQACAAELAPLIACADAPTQQTLHRVLRMIESTVTALEQIAEPFDHETRMVTQQVDRMYVGFQYQDRINQLMTLLYDDIERLSQLSSQHLQVRATPTKEYWLARLESQYAMAEQRLNHTGTTSAVAPATGADETTIFF